MWYVLFGFNYKFLAHTHTPRHSEIKFSQTLILEHKRKPVNLKAKLNTSYHAHLSLNKYKHFNLIDNNVLPQTDFICTL